MTSVARLCTAESIFVSEGADGLTYVTRITPETIEVSRTAESFRNVEYAAASYQSRTEFYEFMRVSGVYLEVHSTINIEKAV